jgi:dUTP pyrophosphatase
MIVNGKKASKFVEILDQSQIQPAGIDLSIKEIHRFVSEGEIDFDNSKRRLSKTEKIEFEEKVHLKSGCYKIIFNEYVKIPSDSIALGFPRSSLLRCGADIHCAVWDPGYEGRSESLLIVHNHFGLVLHKNAKVLQLIFVKLEESSEKLYEGIYKKENI